MKTRPIVAAEEPAIASDAPGFAPDLAPAVTPHPFLSASGLPARWAQRPRFVLLQAGFGAGRAFLATWQAWRDDPARCERLFYVAIEPHPPTRAGLARAHATSPWPALASTLQKAWPPLTANLHAIRFDGDRLQLLLAWGDIERWLPELQLQADAFYLGDGSGDGAAGWDRHRCKALARLAAPGASLAVEGAAPGWRAGLEAAGFQLDPASEPGPDGPGAADRPAGFTTGRYAPRFQPRSRGGATPAPAGPAAQQALVVGAGLAGAAAAAALAALGWQVQVVDRHALPAQETSGNPAGLFHGTLHAEDGVHARLFRAAALAAERLLRPLIEGGDVPGQIDGLLRGDVGPQPAMQALIDRQGLPTDWVQALDASQAGALAGVPLPGPAWHFAGGGWLEPAALVRAWLRQPAVRFSGGLQVAALRREDERWQLLDAAGQVIAAAPVLVLANAAEASRLLAPLGHAPWPLQRSRGQVSGWHGAAAGLRLPVAGDGYALPLAAGGLLCGATVAVDDNDAAVREADHHHNFERLQRLTGLQPPADRKAWFGRVGWRLQADDRLPLVGPVALPEGALVPDQRLDQPRFVPRVPGLHVLTGLGARGITLAPLMGQLLAARIAGTPWPLECDLADAVDPARWRVRQARRTGG